MRVLIVDDSDGARKQLQAAVVELGFSVAGVACNGEEAVSCFRELHPDIVVMDVIMPRMNGMEALQAILALDDQARVVMTCSLKSCEMAFASQNQGARYFLTKPFDEGCLRKVLAKLAEESPGANGGAAGRQKKTSPCSDSPLVGTSRVDPPRPSRSHLPH